MNSNRWFDGAIVAPLLAAVLAGCSPREPAAHAAHEEHEEHDEHHEHAAITLSEDSIARWGVRIGAAERRLLVPTHLVPARVGFNQDRMAHVGSPVSGRVVELKAKLGDEVKAGDVLVVIESTALGEAQIEFVQRASAALATAPSVALAKDAFERARALYDESRGIALAEVQKRESELRANESAALAASVAADGARSRLRLLGMSDEAIERLAKDGAVDPRFSVRSPVDGSVVERAVTLGELVSPEREFLFVVADLSRVWVWADVPESRLQDVVVGAHVRVRIGSMHEHWCDATLAFVSPALDAATRSVRVRIDVADRHKDLRPGVFAEAEIEAAAHDGPREPVLAIPAEAVVTHDGESVVFVPVAGAERTFEPRAVTVGREIAGFVSVSAGLDDGAPLVIAGAFVLEAEAGKSGLEHDD